MSAFSSTTVYAMDPEGRQGTCGPFTNFVFNFVEHEERTKTFLDQLKDMRLNFWNLSPLRLSKLHMGLILYSLQWLALKSAWRRLAAHFILKALQAHLR